MQFLLLIVRIRGQNLGPGTGYTNYGSSSFPSIPYIFSRSESNLALIVFPHLSNEVFAVSLSSKATKSALLKHSRNTNVKIIIKILPEE
jgi:hypothetical protein